MHWQKVVDTETGRVAGGALWNIHKENPFTGPSHPEVTWFPDGGAPRFAEQGLELHNRPRSQAAPKPHVCELRSTGRANPSPHPCLQASTALNLFIIFAHPNYRCKGVAQQFMDWGMKEADRFGFDFYLDSTPYGRPLNETN
ncbi:GNAT family acetyltransferase [Apiospora phragmitis]|uniref:GNAT family acetyltransferase n=1 Tax=Apiospora phragmitis TaxID=2905665 RepID=A0ABR1T8U9_9PEZI